MGLVSSGMLKAATIPFTFTVSGVGSVDSLPSPGSPVVGTTLIGTGLFSAFGIATYSESGMLTFGFFPPDIFGIQSLSNNFTVSFNGGIDTFQGLNNGIFQAPGDMGQAFALDLTITGGTGMFTGASGHATATGLGQPQGETFSGSGQISATGLNAAPEPGTFGLLGASLAALAGIANYRKGRYAC